MAYEGHRMPLYPPTCYPQAREALLRAERFIPSYLKEDAKWRASQRKEYDAKRVASKCEDAGQIPGMRSYYAEPEEAEQMIKRIETKHPGMRIKRDQRIKIYYPEPEEPEQMIKRIKSDSPRKYYPDFFVVFSRRQFGFVEVKSDRGGLEHSQRSAFPELVEKAGQRVWLVRVEPGRSLRWYRIESDGELIPLSDFRGNRPSKRPSG